MTSTITNQTWNTHCFPFQSGVPIVFTYIPLTCADCIYFLHMDGKCMQHTSIHNERNDEFWQLLCFFGPGFSTALNAAGVLTENDREERLSQQKRRSACFCSDILPLFAVLSANSFLHSIAVVATTPLYRRQLMNLFHTVSAKLHVVSAFFHYSGSPLRTRRQDRR